MQKVTRVHFNQRAKFHSVWIEDSSYYNLFGVQHYIKDITETEETTEITGRHEGH
jgi:hypothetical protein